MATGLLTFRILEQCLGACVAPGRRDCTGLVAHNQVLAISGLTAEAAGPGAVMARSLAAGRPARPGATSVRVARGPGRSGRGRTVRRAGPPCWRQAIRRGQGGPRCADAAQRCGRRQPATGSGAARRRLRRARPGWRSARAGDNRRVAGQAGERGDEAGRLPEAGPGLGRGRDAPVLGAGGPVKGVGGLPQDGLPSVAAVACRVSEAAQAASASAAAAGPSHGPDLRGELGYDPGRVLPAGVPLHGRQPDSSCGLHTVINRSALR